MVDSNLKPWLLEVNSGPAMSMDNNIDYQVKPDLIKDIIRMVSFIPYSEYLVCTNTYLLIRNPLIKKLPLQESE